MSWLLVLLPISIWFCWTAFSLLRSYIGARSLNLPIIISPTDPFNLFWILFHKRLIPVLQLLPWNVAAFTHYSYVGWSYDDKFRAHAKYGDAFVLVSPGHLELYIANGEAVNAIVSQRRDFPKPTEMYKPLNVFGKNVDTVEGEEWQRHRKITTPPFNERNSSLVWKESLRQAQDMLTSWCEYGLKGVDTTVSDTMTLALHVLTSAGFGVSYTFKHGLASSPPGHTMSYRDSLAAILGNIVPVFLIPRRLYSLPFLPARLRHIGKAIGEFEAYMTEMVQKERSLISKRDPGTDNLVSSLVRASDQAGEHALSDNEILGNIFIYNLAGHETTANTLAYTVMLLAINPRYQDWLHEELVHVLGPHHLSAASGPAIEEWDYDKVFPQLTRCLATMLETLRLYPPATAIPKYTNTTAQPLVIDGKQHLIPPHTFVNLNVMALHTLPKYWGPNSLDWLPDRWVRSSSAAMEETITVPPGGKGTYVPWSEGARVCPGKKFAQVEFVATLARLFCGRRVRPRLLEGESEREARERVQRVVGDSGVVITLKMRRARDVELVWERR